MKEGRRVNRLMAEDGRPKTEGKTLLSWFLVLGSWLCVIGVFGQSPQVNFSCKKYPFVHDERNEIVNAKVLNDLFDKLYLQRTAKNQRISILQIGDSHIQADMLSGRIRTNFQNDFGNAGRGLVIPIRVAGSNEPYNYRITSNVKCYGKRCVYVNDSLDYGIGGFAVKTSSDTAQFRIRTFDYPPLNYAFNKMTLFYQQDSSYLFSLEDSLGNKLGAVRKDTSLMQNVSVVHLPANTNEVYLKAQREDSSESYAILYGMNLENDSSGVLYHAIGVNGAEAFQYVHAKYFAQQTQVLKPEVIIISLGTNEAQRRPFDKHLVEARLDSLVKQLQVYHPGKPVILTTPPDSYFHRKNFNTAIATYHEMTVDYAKKNNLAVWDLFSATGGYKSCYQWKKYHLMQRDGVHFTRAGYELQGNLFYEAITKAYNNYVGHRLQ